MAEVADVVDFRSIILNKRLVSIRQELDPHVGEFIRSTMKMEGYADMFVDRMVYDLTAYVLAHKVVDESVELFLEHTVSYPSTWWQMFKHDVLTRSRFTRWFVRWRPVRWTEEYSFQRKVANFKEYVTFPEATITYPEWLGSKYVFVQEVAVK